MVPYFELPSFHVVGPITIHPFGVMMLLGFLVAFLFSRHRAQQAGLDADAFLGGQKVGLVATFVLGHLTEILFYQRHRLAEEGPLLLLNIFDGISSYGGFLGGTVGFLAYWRLKQPGTNWLLSGECILQGAVMGWVFGRFGCTLAHDHPGRMSDFLLAVQYPSGSRHDLGFYELLFTALVMAPAVLWLHRRRAPPGSYTATVLLLYGPTRFFMDFLRLDPHLGGDPRYGGLTVAQYGSLAFIVIGAIVAVRLWRARHRPPAPAVVQEET